MIFLVALFALLVPALLCLVLVLRRSAPGERAAIIAASVGALSGGIGGVPLWVLLDRFAVFSFIQPDELGLGRSIVGLGLCVPTGAAAGAALAYGCALLLRVLSTRRSAPSDESDL